MFQNNTNYGKKTSLIIAIIFLVNIILSFEGYSETESTRSLITLILAILGFLINLYFLFRKKNEK